MENRIAYYYQELEVPVSSDDDLSGLIDLHTKSFEYYGWEVIHVDESTARQHPSYAVFDKPDSILSKSVNAWEYTRACYMRWLAYAVAGCPYADFDVINYGFSPDDARQIKRGDPTGYPAFISGVGAMGLLYGVDYDLVIGTYLDFVSNPRGVRLTAKLVAWTSNPDATPNHGMDHRISDSRVCEGLRRRRMGDRAACPFRLWPNGHRTRLAL